MNEHSTPQTAFSEPIVTDYVHITQERIDNFAGATEDRQWIHTDAPRAALHSPFKTTVAHGFLTLALLPHLLSRHIDDPAYGMRINYGFNHVRLLSPVRVNAKVRAHARLLKEAEIRNGIERTWDIMLECEGGKIPACVAEWVVRYYGEV
jgi:acyl dehydratase